jgi:hypothetical protein
MEQYPQNDQISKAKEAGIRFYSSPEEQEEARLQEALNRTPTERFQFLMHLMKLQRLMNQEKTTPKKSNGSI